MPSKSYLNFLHMRKDVLKIIGTYAHYRDNNLGNRSLGYLTRSGVVMLCAAWERYNEDLLLECIDELCLNISDINDLPIEVKKTLSRLIKEDQHHLSPIELGGDGWKAVWKNYATIRTEKINTPKVEILNMFFKQYLGINNYSQFWTTVNNNEIDIFISDRGDIAHNGNNAAYIRMSKLRRYQEMIVDNVINIDSMMALELRAMSNANALPWSQDYSRKLSYYR
jgi:hypothetical protein